MTRPTDAVPTQPAAWALPEHWLVPQWPAPPGVHALCTARTGGVSQGPYASMNLGSHVGDDPQAVQALIDWARQGPTHARVDRVVVGNVPDGGEAPQAFVPRETL